MRKLKLIAVVAGMAAATVVSCSKQTPEEAVTTSGKGTVANTSATVKGYWKDDVTTVTSINVTPGNQRMIL
ncbi:MAG TPA: hypothetical protein VGD22_12555, partial [Sphingobacteriaceae bacterium]